MLKKLSIAVSAALISSSAFAVAPTTAPDLEIFMSGASAQDKGIAALFSDLCVAGTLDVYKDVANPAKKGKAHTAYFCNIDSAKIAGGTPASGANPTVLFHKRSKGGSAQGVNPVIDEQAIDAMAINNTSVATSGNCTETATGSKVWDCTIGNVGDLVKQVSDAGVSDVNPEMFIKQNTPFGSSPVDAAVVSAKMDVRGAAALVFGIPVTTTLRDALQLAAFGPTSNCVTDKYDPTNPADVPTIHAAETEACMPTLSRAQVASIMQGNVKRWSSFFVNGTALTSIPGITLPSDNKVHVCRRVNGSGTQAQMSAKFLSYPCTAGGVSPRAASNSFFGPIIVENSGSGDMTQCLNDLNDGTNVSNRVNPSLKTAWAVGIQSTEKNADLGDNFRFIKIDGYAPTLENAVAGRYADVVEQTFQWRKNGALPLTGDKLNIVSTIAANASKPTVLATVTKLNPSYIHPWGQAGYLALSTNGFTPTIPFDVNNPVTPYSHAIGGPLDNCRMPVVNPAVANSEL